MHILESANKDVNMIDTAYVIKLEKKNRKA